MWLLELQEDPAERLVAGAFLAVRDPPLQRKRVPRKTALREIARAYLAGAGMSLLGETARASGLSRVEAGSGNHQLVDEGYAIRVRRGIYALASAGKGDEN